MKFYAEILHPYKDEVLWHYFLEAPDEATAQDAISKQVGFEEFRKVNKNFEYRIIFSAGIQAEQVRLLEEIKKL